MDIVTLAILCYAAQLAAHYFPLSRLLGHKPHQVVNYIIGTAIIALPFTGWALMYGYVRPVIALWAAIVASGLAVIGGYALDAYFERSARAEDLEEQVALLERRE